MSKSASLPPRSPSSPTQMGSPAYSARSGTHSPLTDSFLDAKAQCARRISSYENNRAQAGSSTSLPVVPENRQNAQPAPQSKPASSYKLADKRKLPRTGSGLSGDRGRRISGGSDSDDGVLTMNGTRSYDKGKGKETLTSGMRGIPEERTIKKARWILDPTEMQLGSETWSNSLRVVLVLGHVTVEALEPMLYNPTFANTLLLIGSYKPVPEIDALLSPSYLLSSSPERAICPTLQPFQPSGKANGTDAHDLTVLLNQATILAKQYRSQTALATRSRQGSFSSTSNSPPSTPGGKRNVLSGLGLGKTTPPRRGSLDSTENDRPSPSAYDSERPRILNSMSSGSLLVSSRSSRSRISSMSRDNFLGGMFKLDSDAKSSGEGPHLFDAVINFMPPMSMFKPQRAMQDMLHQAVVITTGCVPALVRHVGGKTSNDTLPITLLHVLPPQAPPALAPVLESFVLSLLPSFQARCSRELFGCVVTPSVWSSPLVSMSSNAITEDGVSGAEVLLVGGVRCLHQIVKAKGRAEDFKPRAFLYSWESCLSMCGVIAESRRPSESRKSPTSAFRSVTRQNSPGDPPSVNFNDVQARTPPQTSEHFSPTASAPNSSQLPSLFFSQPSSSPKPTLLASALPPIQTQIQHQRKSKLSLVTAACDRPNSPPTPDLDRSISSCSSSFALGETNSQGSGSSGSANAAATGSGSDNAVRVVKEGEFGRDNWEDGKESKKKGGRGIVSGWFKRAIAKNIKV
ncbi:hypothetical protein D1P53_000348 [Cryptococcus gattii VGV]|nr:hypothetical protein D1P53_000348 [Cryptococcus gattii VGV]